MTTHIHNDNIIISNGGLIMARNIKGDGTIYYDTSRERWKGELKWTDKNGTHHRKVFTSTQKKGGKTIVREKLNKFIEELNVINNGRGGASPLLKDIIEEWLQDEKLYIKPTTFMRKKSTVENHIMPAFGDMPIETITHVDIQNLINDMSKSGQSYSSVKKVYEALNACIRFYRHKQQIYFNPCENIRIPTHNKKDPSDIEFFDERQIGMIEEEIRRTYKTDKKVYRMGESVIIILYTGIRIGELLALEWTDIDFINNTISITKDAALVANEEGKYDMVIQKTPKTKKSNRVIPMTDKAKEAFLQIKQITGNCQYVMTTSNGSIIRPYNLDKMFAKVLRNTGIIDEGESYGVHTLRHTFASLLFKNGIETKIISELLGHSSVKVTEDIYIHLIQQQKTSAIQTIDKISFAKI